MRSFKIRLRQLHNRPALHVFRLESRVLLVLELSLEDTSSLMVAVDNVMHIWHAPMALHVLSEIRTV